MKQFRFTDTQGRERTVVHPGTLRMLFNAGEIATAVEAVESTPYNAMNRDALRKVAAEKQIAGRGKMTKDQLVTALEAAEASVVAV